MKVDGMFGPIDIAMSGMKAQSRQIEAITSNVANARTTNGGDGQPYRRIEAIFKTTGQGVAGVELDEFAKDMSGFEGVFDPGNPAANAEGMVLMPNVKLPVEIMNLTLASRAYQANAAVLKRYTEIVNSALELLR